MIFAGAASKPPLEEIVAAYEEKTGVSVDLVLGGSGYVLSQMRLAGRGDIYFPGSSDYMEIAKRAGDVFPETEEILVYLVPAINVQRGNPRGINGLRDLLQPGLRVAIANPEGVCVGAYAVEILEENLTEEEIARFRENLANYTSSCERTATAISLRQVDAVLGWRVFEDWDPGRIETVTLDPEEIPRIGYIPAAISTHTKNRNGAERFMEFLTSDEGREIFAAHKYFSSAREAFDFLGTEKPIGGEYQTPARWLNGGMGGQ